MRPLLINFDITLSANATTVAGRGAAPLIAVAQLANYASTLELAGVDQRFLVKRVLATTGHSQGLATATCIGSARTFDELLERAKVMLPFLLYLSARSQQATDTFLEATSSIRTPPRRPAKRTSAGPRSTPEGPAEPTVMMVSASQSWDVQRFISIRLP